MSESPSTESTLLERVHAWLEANHCTFRTLRHEPTPTSEDSARARGEPLEIGAKAIVLKIEKTFYVFVLSAAAKLDTACVREYFKTTGRRAKKIRFATADELFHLTGTVPGAVPPFGRPIVDLQLFVDERLTRLERVAFNAGTMTDSVVMPAPDYLRAANPVVFSFSSTG